MKIYFKPVYIPTSHSNQSPEPFFAVGYKNETNTGPADKKIPPAF